jgi:hypothetical protein
VERYEAPDPKGPRASRAEDANDYQPPINYRSMTRAGLLRVAARLLSELWLATNKHSAYGSTVRPLVLSVTVMSVNETVIGGMQSGVNVAVSVTL